VIFFYPAGLSHLAQRNLHAATVQRRGGTARALEAGMAVGKQQHTVTVHRPEAAQYIACGIGQRHQAVLIALGIADMHPFAHRIDITDLKSEPLAEAQAQAVDGKVENTIAELFGGLEDSASLLDGNDIGQALGLGWLDQIDIDPGVTEHMGVVELEPVEIELDRAPRVGREQIRKIIGQLLFGQVINVVLKIITDASDGTGISLNGFRLKAFELEMLQVLFVIALEFSFVR
jgi:hypothetical protein